MTPSTVCIAHVSIPRANTFELERLRRCGPHVEFTMSPANPLERSAYRCQVAGERYFTHIRANRAAELFAETGAARLRAATHSAVVQSPTSRRHAGRISLPPLDR